VEPAYYNEIDSFACQVIRNLIGLDAIPWGHVDKRSITDVTPGDLKGYAQCHFFAGFAVWSYALRKAGWSDERPVWTGSCPCPPFSSAGKKKQCPECGGKPLCHAYRAGFFRCTTCGHDWLADERHLWPEFHRLIRECRPDIVFGEQVAGRDGEAWLDVVQATLEVEDYTCGSASWAACGVGAPHKRQRLYWCAVGNADSERRNGKQVRLRGGRPQQSDADATGAGGIGVTADADSGRVGRRRTQGSKQGVEASPGQSARERSKGFCATGSVADTSSPGLPARECQELSGANRDDQGRATEQCGGALDEGLRGPTNGHWRDADWLGCRDGKWRPVEPGTFPLVDGSPNRVGSLRGYGNAIVAQQAEQFVRSVMEIV